MIRPLVIGLFTLLLAYGFGWALLVGVVAEADRADGLRAQVAREGE